MDFAASGKGESVKMRIEEGDESIFQLFEKVIDQYRNRIEELKARNRMLEEDTRMYKEILNTLCRRVNEAEKAGKEEEG